MFGGKKQIKHRHYHTFLVLPVEVRRNWGWQRDTFRVNVVGDNDFFRWCVLVHHHHLLRFFFTKSLYTTQNQGCD